MMTYGKSKSRGTATPAPAPERSFHMQAKPALHTNNETVEHEVGRIADQALAMPAQPASAPRMDADHRFDHDFSRMRVHPASPVADQAGANAVTLGHAVHLSSGLPRLGKAEQQRVLAHEAVHVAQRFAAGPAASRLVLETEAHNLTRQKLAGHAVQPRFHADASTVLADDGGQLPGDRIAVAKAQERRKVLLRYKAIYDGSQGDVAAERKNILAKRDRLDDSMAIMMAAIEQRSGQKGRAVEEYQQEEQKKAALLNTKPLSFEVTPTAVRIRARFQVRFEGMGEKDAKVKFPILDRNFRKGVRDTWNQKLSGSVLSGRTFEMIPELSLIPETAARDPNFWLITVRPTNKGPMVYGKTKLGTAPGGIPTSVTISELDGGVMSIPPSHIELAETLGHETLHLFAMVDRYAIIPAALSPTRQDEPLPLRDAKGRLDPLAAEGGKILEEDLGYVLDELGIYPDMTQSDVLTELSQVDEIIRTGRDPHSLIPKRSQFEKEIIKQAEDLD